MKRRLLTVVLVVLSLLTLAPVFGQDISTTLGVLSGVPAASYSADFTGPVLDVGNYDACVIVVSTASGPFESTNGFTIALMQCASSTGTFTAVGEDDVVGVTPNASGTIVSLIASQSTPDITKIGYIGRYPYIRMDIDEIGTATATPIVGVVIGGRPHLAPVSD